VAIDLALLDHLDGLSGDVELYLTRAARVDDPQADARLRSVPGVGPVLALVLLYEIHDIRRFDQVGQFLSYARLVRCVPESGARSSRPTASGGRSATRTCVGPSRRRRVCSCGPARGPNRGNSGRRRSGARARRWPAWRPGWVGPSTTCCVRVRSSTSSASGGAGRPRQRGVAGGRAEDFAASCGDRGLMAAPWTPASLLLCCREKREDLNDP
jgi:Transposase IS116/IS110/IS902 family